MKKISLFIFAAMLSAQGFAQTDNKEVPLSWYQKDQKKDNTSGISLQQAYDFLKSKNLKSKTIIVAVEDSGIDTLHEDLKPVLWRNAKEIPGNGIDDDKNGYVDDVYGWNFLGGKDGRNVDKDSYEAARVYHKLKAKWEGKTEDGLTGADKAEYAEFIRAKNDLAGDPNEAMQRQFYAKLLPKIKAGDSVISKEIAKKEYNADDLKDYTPTDENAIGLKKFMAQIASGGDVVTNVMLVNELQGLVDKGDALDVAPQNYRADVVKDNYSDFNDRFYGNGDVMAGTPMHGTHVSGIIGAARNNGVGMNGVADDVKILTVRAVPDGDEHDKDITLGVIYAVDNGAKVINMSFGKSFSPEKNWVDDAFKYAAKHDVLIVHAAGNSTKNIDTTYNFPTAIFADGKTRAENVITVGASGDKSNGGIVASFSNYGKRDVDVFAPGVQIYSTLPGGNKYGNLQGTSMASPVVAGIAALLRSYFPTLTAVEIKKIIENSVVKITEDVQNHEADKKTKLSELSKTGGIVNAYNAVVMAYEKVYGKSAGVTETKEVVKTETTKTKVKTKAGKSKIKRKKK